MTDFQTRIGNVSMKDSASNRALVLGDSLANVITGMQGGTDPMRGAFYTANLINQQTVDNAFQTSPFAKKCHVIPATDATRAWRKWSSKDAEITKIEAEEKRLGLQAKVRRAEIISRMYGGSAIILGIKNGNLAEELDVDSVSVGGLSYIHVVSRHKITVPNLDLDPGSPWYGQPSEYILTGGNGQAIPCHPSRVVRFVHGDLPDDILERNSGWGDPLLTSLWGAVVNSDTAQNTFASLIPKSVIDTVYIPGLTSMAATVEGEEMLKRRFVVAKLFESTLSVKLMDAPESKDGAGERWDTRQITWTGIPELMRAFMQMLAGASDVPLTRLLGSSADGMNATGEGDQRNYHDHIAALQDLSLRPRLDMIDAVLVRSALGDYPESTDWRWNPLIIDSDEVRAKNAKVRAEATKIYSDTGTVPEEVLQEAVKNQLIESGEYPGIEQAYDTHAAGLLEPLVETEEADNDNEAVLAATTAGLQQQGVADAAAVAVTLLDSTPRSLYVSRAVLNADEIQAWMTEQGLGELQPDPHVTILYSRQHVDWLEMGTSWADRDNDGSGNLQITAGGPRVVEPLGDRTAVLMFSSTDLQWRHREMVEAGASHDYPDYTPHISLTGETVDLTNVQPYRGKILLGPEIFSELRE